MAPGLPGQPLAASAEAVMPERAGESDSASRSHDGGHHAAVSPATVAPDVARVCQLVDL
jgi:hypothetical protein